MALFSNTTGVHIIIKTSNLSFPQSFNFLKMFPCSFTHTYIGGQNYGFTGFGCRIVALPDAHARNDATIAAGSKIDDFMTFEHLHVIVG